MDEWIYFLKHSEFPETIKAKGLEKAKKKLAESVLNPKDRAVYLRYMENKMIENSVKETAEIEGIEKGIEKREIEAVFGLRNNKISVHIITKLLNISKKRVQEIIKLGYSKKNEI